MRNCKNVKLGDETRVCHTREFLRGEHNPTRLTHPLQKCNPAALLENVEGGGERKLKIREELSCCNVKMSEQKNIGETRKRKTKQQKYEGKKMDGIPESDFPKAFFEKLYQNFSTMKKKYANQQVSL